MSKQISAVEWLIEQLTSIDQLEIPKGSNAVTSIIDQAKQMEKEQMLDFGEFIIDELEPMAQNREWVEERYNYFKSE